MESRNLNAIQEKIDSTVKHVWRKLIKRDYQNLYLLKEDTLKNALYFHIRNDLTDTFLEENNIRIYTEYYYKGMIADIVIVQLNEEPGYKDFIKDEVESVLAVIEIKYKGAGNEKPFEDDVKKIDRYMTTPPNDQTQYYLAFIHEIVYENNEGDSWLTKSQQEWAKGRVTELSGYYVDGKEELEWRVLSHNYMNPDISFDKKLSRQKLVKAAGEFDEIKYSKELYHYCLHVIKNASNVNEDLTNAVKYLIYWKLGKISRTPTPKGEPILWTDGFGLNYYVVGTTSSNKNAMNKALTEELLVSGMEFRDNRLSYDEFKFKVETLTKTSIVLPSFYIHIWKPEEYPIVDVKVWRTYKWNKEEIVTKHTKPNSWAHYEEYTTFFRKLVKETELDWRTVDKGLWSIGDEVKKSIREKGAK